MRAIDLINKLKAYSRSSEKWRDAEVSIDYRNKQRMFLVLTKESGDKLSIDLGEIK